MVFTVTMNPRAQQIRKHGNSSSSVVNGFPANKRPRVGSSPVSKPRSLNTSTSKGHRLGSGYDSGVNTTSSQNNNDDLFGDDDIFTGDALAELELVASQVENAAKHDNNLSAGKGFKDSAKQQNSKNAGQFTFKQPSNFSKNAASSKTSYDGPNDINAELKKLRQQCAQYELKIKDFELRNKQSSGEASLLRDKLHTAERVLHEERQLKSAETTRIKNEKNQKELELAKKVEVFKDQMQFKEAELKEAQTLIRNLETKNKMLVEESKLVSSAKEGMFSTQRLSQVDDVSHKKIKFVKPESPRVPSSKHKVLKVDSPRSVAVKSPSSSQESKPIKVPGKRRVCRLQNLTYTSKHLPNPAQAQLIDSLQTLLLEFRHYCMVHDGNPKDRQSYTDTIDSIENLISSSLQTSDEYVIQIFSTLTVKIKRHLSTWNDRQENSQDAENVNVLTSMNVMNFLIRVHPTVTRSIMDKDFDILSLVNSHLSQPQINDPIELTSKLLEFVSLISQNSTKSHVMINRFAKTVGILSTYIIQPTVRDHALNIALNFIGFQTLVEKMVSPNQGVSFLSTLCAATAEEAALENPSTSFLSKVVALLSELTCKHEELLMKQECFAELYHTLNVILYYQLTHWETEAAISPPRDRLISQSICLLHSCSNIYVDGIPGVARDHKHPLVLWKLQRFLERRSGETFWLSELRKIVNSEISSVEQLA